MRFTTPEMHISNFKPTSQGIEALNCVCVPQTLEDVFLKLSQQQDLQLSKEAAKGASIVSNEFAYHVDLIYF